MRILPVMTRSPGCARFNFGPDGKAAEPLFALSAATLAKYATIDESHVTMLMKDGPAIRPRFK